MTLTNTHSPITIINQSSINNRYSFSLSLSRHLMIIIITLNRELYYNQLSGTIPSSIGSLVKLLYLYAQSNT